MKNAMLKELKKKFAEVSGPAVLANAVYEVLSNQHPFDQQKEHCFTIGLNVRRQIQFLDLVSLGILDQTPAHPREVFRMAIHEGVSEIAIVHNHPCGDVNPSDQDLEVTRQMITCGMILRIPLFDHVIVGKTMNIVA